MSRLLENLTTEVVQEQQEIIEWQGKLIVLLHEVLSEYMTIEEIEELEKRQE